MLRSATLSNQGLCAVVGVGECEAEKTSVDACLIPGATKRLNVCEVDASENLRLLSMLHQS